MPAIYPDDLMYYLWGRPAVVLPTRERHPLLCSKCDRPMVTTHTENGVSVRLCREHGKGEK